MWGRITFCPPTFKTVAPPLSLRSTIEYGLRFTLLITRRALQTRLMLTKMLIRLCECFHLGFVIGVFVYIIIIFIRLKISTSIQKISEAGCQRGTNTSVATAGFFPLDLGFLVSSGFLGIFVSNLGFFI